MAIRPMLALACGLAVAMAVSACGRQGSLERPQPESQAQEGESGNTASGPSRPFILDGLVR